MLGISRIGLALTFCLAAVTLPAQDAKPVEWQSLFDGKSLQGWKETPFRAGGPVRIEKGTIVLGAGKPLTGINLIREFPRSNYEVRFEAARQQGSDFFASLTFPVKDTFCTLVTGGWGGDIVGLSSFEGWDASENQTRTYVTFEPGRWYAFRLRVTDDRISVYIDEERLIDMPIAGRLISLRPGEIELSAPFGFASYGTTGALRKIEYRVLQPARP
jgi:hypothetical protein